MSTNQPSGRELLKAKADSLSETEVLEVLEYINIMESLRQETPGPDPFDEAIFQLLSEALRATYTQRIATKN